MYMSSSLSLVAAKREDFHGNGWGPQKNSLPSIYSGEDAI
jgi:hypothetical protein